MDAHLSWKLLGSRYVRQHRIYDSMRWALELDLSNCLVAGAPFGGPLAMTRDTTKLMELRGAADDDIMVYSPVGQPVRARARARFLLPAPCSPAATLSRS
jgi:hypothetical protein